MYYFLQLQINIQLSKKSKSEKIYYLLAVNMKVGLQLKNNQFATFMIQIRSDMMLSVLRNVNEEQDIFMVSKCLLKDRLLNLRQVKIVILYWRNHLYCGIKMIISKASRMETLCLRRTERLPCGGQAEDVKTKSNHEATDKQNT